jgi:hypothetical protein
MKKPGLFLFLVLAVVLGSTSVSAFAQAPAGDGSLYFVTYYSNASPAYLIPQTKKAGTVTIPDAVVRVINDGDTGGNLYASYYVFDDSQELQECCSCFVSPDGLNSEDVNYDLLGNTLTGVPTTTGVIKIISSSVGDPTQNTPTAGLRGFATHIQGSGLTTGTKKSVATSGPYYVTEAPLADSNLASGEKTMLEQLCKFEIILGSGYGTCTCTQEDWDF